MFVTYLIIHSIQVKLEYLTFLLSYGKEAVGIELNYDRNQRFYFFYFMGKGSDRYRTKGILVIELFIKMIPIVLHVPEST